MNHTSLSRSLLTPVMSRFVLALSLSSVWAVAGHCQDNAPKPDTGSVKVPAPEVAAPETTAPDTVASAAQPSVPKQWVEGFDQVVFHYNANNGSVTRDFRGMARGYMTAGWWAPGQMKNNTLSWKTAPVPVKQATTFVFVGAMSPLPSQFSRGPLARLTVNGHYALTFSLGFTRDFTWREGGYELKYLSKRVEFPFFGQQREMELSGDSGFYQLSVPANAVEAGQGAVLRVDLLPFPAWNDGWFMVKDRRDALQQTMDTLEGELTALRQDMVTINMQTQILATKTYPELNGGNRFPSRVVYTDGYRHLHPADLIKLRDGEILFMAREASEHIANDGDVFLLRSKDGGQTWGQKQWIARIKDVDEREGCGIQLRDGTILMGVFYNDLYNPDGSYNNIENKLAQSSGKHYLGAYTITSRDNGHTWSAPSYVETTGMPLRNIEGPTDAPIEMPDGSILMAVIGYNFEGDTKNRASVMLRSTDKGKTWKYLSVIGSDPRGKLGGFMEPGIVRLKSGRIVAAMRNGGPDQAIWTTYSDDSGKTWVPVQHTKMIGHPADLIQLADGRVLATYGIRPIHALSAGVRACFSRDDGKTWDINSEVQIRNDFFNWDVGYPDSMQMPDGQILTVYYYNLFGRYFLGSTVWRP